MVASNVHSDIPSRLVVFDVEGVLLPERRYLLVAARKLGLWGFINVVVIGVFYEIGLLSLESALSRIFKHFQGVHIDDLFRLYKDLPLIFGAEKVFERLSMAGYRTVLISSGLPMLFVKDLVNRLNADYGFGLELETRDGFLTGKVWGDVLKPEGKALILKRILKDEMLSPQDCIVIADDRNNLQMFPLCAMKIGYNPDFIISAKADFAVTGDLSNVLPTILGTDLDIHNPVLSRSEVIRELVHLSGGLVPLLLWYRLTFFFNRYLISFLLFFVIILYSLSELARIEGVNFPIFSTITWRMATMSELQEFATDPIFFALGIAFSLIFFPEPTCYASIAILVFGDSAAMIFGRVLGRTVLPFNKRKKLEGSVFGFIFAFIGAMLFISPVKSLISAATGMVAESLPSPISDNLTVPMVAGLVLMIL